MRKAFLAPAGAAVCLLIYAPLVIVAAYSVMQRGPYGEIVLPLTLENFQRAFDPLYGRVFVRTLALSAMVTAVTLLLAFPLAFGISRAGRAKTLLLQLLLLPFWSSFLVRTYAWMFLLRDTGLVNTFLQRLGVIHEPLPLLYNDGAVMLGLIYSYLPFAVLPIYVAMERLDRSVLEAALDLGARPLAVTTRILIPLTKPGIGAAAALVFIPCVGAYLTPDLLGGSKSYLLGNLIQNQFTTARDWPFGCALAVLVFGFVLGPLMIAGRRVEEAT